MRKVDEKLEKLLKEVIALKTNEKDVSTGNTLYKECLNTNATMPIFAVKGFYKAFIFQVTHRYLQCTISNYKRNTTESGHVSNGNASFKRDLGEYKTLRLNITLYAHK